MKLAVVPVLRQIDRLMIGNGSGSDVDQALGNAEYYQACERARSGLRAGEKAEAHRWSKVAREIGSCHRMNTRLNGLNHMGLEQIRMIELASTYNTGERKPAEPKSPGPSTGH